MTDPTPDRVERVARVMHDAYEEAAVQEGWKTQGSCHVPFDDLPEANKRVMLISVRAAIAAMDDGWELIETIPEEYDYAVEFKARIKSKYDSDGVVFTHWRPLPEPPA